MKWEGKLDNYERLLQLDQLNEKDKEPNISGLYFYIECFFELNTCRSSLSVAPIPFTAIVEFAKVYGVEDVEEFLYYIRCMDASYMKSTEKKDGTTNADKEDSN